MEYRILKHRGKSRDMEDLVQGYLNKGWRPQGGITTSYDKPSGNLVFIQAVIKE